MAKLIGNPEWVVQPGYPEVSGQDGEESVTVKIIATAAGLAKNLPTYGSCFDPDDPFFSRFNYLQLIGRTIATDQGRKTYTVTLTYGVKESDEGSEATVRREVEYNTQDNDVPLAQHPRYRVRWNHVLLAKAGTTAIPAWWETAAEKTLSSEDAALYAWAKPDEKVPEGWFCLCAESKPGVESFRSGICTVTEISRSTNKSFLERSAARDYTIQTPPDTFGRSGEWLRGGSSIRKTGKYWELTVTYLNSETVDQDIYE